jgi:hypothetical protein
MNAIPYWAGAALFVCTNQMTFAIQREAAA